MQPGLARLDVEFNFHRSRRFFLEQCWEIQKLKISQICFLDLKDLNVIDSKISKTNCDLTKFRIAFYSLHLSNGRTIIKNVKNESLLCASRMINVFMMIRHRFHTYLAAIDAAAVQLANGLMHRKKFH